MAKFRVKKRYVRQKVPAPLKEENFFRRNEKTLVCLAAESLTLVVLSPVLVVSMLVGTALGAYVHQRSKSRWQALVLGSMAGGAFFGGLAAVMLNTADTSALEKAKKAVRAEILFREKTGKTGSFVLSNAEAGYDVTVKQLRYMRKHIRDPHTGEIVDVGYIEADLKGTYNKELGAGLFLRSRKIFSEVIKTTLPVRDEAVASPKLMQNSAPDRR